MSVLTRRKFLKVAAAIPVAATYRNTTSPVLPVLPERKGGKRMTAPQTITVPPLAGLLQNSPIQIPSVSSGTPTVVNLSPNLTIVLCNDSNFVDTWNLLPGMSQPLPNSNSPFAQNPNDNEVVLLILDGPVPVTFYTPPNQGGLSDVTVIVPPSTPTELLPAPPDGFAYKIQLINYSSTAAVPNGESVFIGVYSTAYIFKKGATLDNVGLTLSDTVQMNGSLVTGAIFAESTNLGFDLTMYYDLVPI
jgi:hypothetical protein